MMDHEMDTTSLHYVGADASVEGPVTLDDLCDLYDCGEVNDLTLVWHPDADAWHPLASSSIMPLLRQRLEMDGPLDASSTIAADTGSKYRGRDKVPSRTAAQAGPRSGSNVYVSGLAVVNDCTNQELSESDVESVFKKAGVIRNVRLYRDGASRKLKGDALVQFLRPESVGLAIVLLDQSVVFGSRITVQEAKFDMEAKQRATGSSQPPPPTTKAKTASSSAAASVVVVAAAAAGGGGTAATAAGAALMREELKKKIVWTLYDDAVESGRGKDGVADKSQRGQRTVVFRNMFDPKDLETNLTASLEIKEDVEAMAETIGEFFKVKVHDFHPQGVVTVKFKDPKDARECVDRLNGKRFDNRVVAAALWDGVELFDEPENPLDDEKRLEKFSAWLESQGPHPEVHASHPHEPPVERDKQQHQMHTRVAAASSSLRDAEPVGPSNRKRPRSEDE
eukprot:ANDGO_02203.mRNA.1 Splicing factor U2AF-associated protein 2